MRTSSTKLLDLVKKIRARTFVIPQFQRDFVWSESQIKLLIDSIARNYPIGSLLLSEELSFPLAFRSIEAEIKDEGISFEGEREKLPNTSMVLDGQQRLTSIARFFLNSDPKKNYYFDLEEMYENFSEVDADSSINWIKTNPRNKKSDPTVKKEGRYLRSDVVIEGSNALIYALQYFRDYFKSKNVENYDEEASKATAKINGIFEFIRNYEVPYILLDGNEGIDSICRVFETINSTGTRLTTFDLAVARYYPEPNIRELYEDGILKYDILGKNGFDVDGERILQLLTIIYQKQKGTFVEATRTEILSLDRKFIEDNWMFACLSVSKSFNWIVKHCGTSKSISPGHGLIVALAGLFMVFGYEEVINKPSMNYQLRKWMFCNMLQDGIRRTSYDIGKDFKSLLDLFEKEKYFDMPRVSITIEDIIGLNSRDNKYKAILAILCLFGKEDIILLSNIQKDVEFHHIYPRSLAKKYSLDKNLVNSIANIMPISSSTNKDILDRSPSEYFQFIMKNAESKGLIEVYNKILSNHSIPHKMDESITEYFSIDNFKNFLSARASEILLKIRELVGDSLRTDEEASYPEA